jgi:hypothetical protein
LSLQAAQHGGALKVALKPFPEMVGWGGKKFYGIVVSRFFAIFEDSLLWDVRCFS